MADFSGYPRKTSKISKTSKSVSETVSKTASITTLTGFTVAPRARED